MQSIRKAGRNTAGVIIVSVDKNDKVVSIAKCPKEDEEIELDENGNIIRYTEDGEILESIIINSEINTTPTLLDVLDLEDDNLEKGEEE